MDYIHFNPVKHRLVELRRIAAFVVPPARGQRGSIRQDGLKASGAQPGTNACYIDPCAVPLVADALNVSRAEVHGVLSFYPDFTG